MGWNTLLRLIPFRAQRIFASWSSKVLVPRVRRYQINSFFLFLASCVFLGFGGCGSGVKAPAISSPSGVVPLRSGGATSVYVLQQGDPYLAMPTSSYVLQFSNTSNGTATPVNTITLPSEFVANSIALDSSGKLYVGGSQANLNTKVQYGMVYEYAAGASGMATPLHSFRPLSTPLSMAVDATGQLYVLCGGLDYQFLPSISPLGAVAVYPPDSDGYTTGLVSPSRTIQGASTQLSYVSDLALDNSGNIYVTASPASGAAGAVLEFSANQSGNVAPSRTLMHSGKLFSGLDVDAAGMVYVGETTSTGTDAEIAVFAATASGESLPSRVTTTGGANGALAGGLRLDGAGNLFTTVVTSTTVPSFALQAFGPGASGSSAATEQFSSPVWFVAGREIAVH